MAPIRILFGGGNFGHRFASYPESVPSGKLVRLDYATKSWYFSSDPIANPSVLHNGYKVHPDIEVQRNYFYNKLKYQFYRLFNNPKINHKTGIYERWLWTQLALQPVEKDPLIPYSALTTDIRLEFELENTFKVSPTMTKSVLTSVSALSKEYCQQLMAMKDTRKCKIISEWSGNMLMLSYRNKTVKINRERYDILKKDYTGQRFIIDLYCLLLRYFTLGGNGYQAAAPAHVFDYMNTKLKVKQECFASPLNHYLSNYCSAFPDTDIKFGSSGSFFHFMPKSGWFEVNPPFAELVMQRMVEHMEYLLANTKKSLAFVVIVPKWSDDRSPMWIMMMKSRFLIKVLDIKPGHKYYVGDQHAIKQYWSTTHTTSIFLLKNTLQKKLDSFDNLVNIWQSS